MLAGPCSRPTGAESPAPGIRSAAGSRLEREQRRTTFLEPRPGDSDRIGGVGRQSVDQRRGPTLDELPDHRRHCFLARSAAAGDTALDARRRVLMDLQAGRRRLGEHDAARFADAQRGLHTLAVEGLLDGQFVRHVRRNQRSELGGQRTQPLRQLYRTTAEPQHTDGNQANPGIAATARPHDVARSHRHRHDAARRPARTERDLETAVSHHLRARIDAQNPDHRHDAECKVCAVKIAMLLLAAGRGTRFGGALPKAFLRLGDRTLLVASAQRLLQALPAGATAELLVLVHPDDRASHLAAALPQLREVAGPTPVRCVDGGDTRQQSMANGLAACPADADLVLVHDAARALLPIAATRDCIAAAARTGAALLAIPAPDTLKKVADGRVVTTLDRRDVWQAQTPQVIRRDLLAKAMDHAHRNGFAGTDDVSLVEALGEPVAVVRGSPTNLKITHADDLPLANAILAAHLA